MIASVYSSLDGRTMYPGSSEAQCRTNPGIANFFISFHPFYDNAPRRRRALFRFMYLVAALELSLRT